MRVSCHHAVEHHVHLATDQIGDGLGAAFVRHITPFNPVALREYHAGQMRRTAHASCHGVIQFAFLRFGIRHQLCRCIGRHFGAHRQEVRRVSHHAHGGKIVDDIEGQFEQGWTDDQIANVHQCQGVTIGCGFGHKVCAQVATCTRTIFDHHRLAPVFCDFLTKDAGQHIRGAACGKGHHNFDGFGRKTSGCLREGSATESQTRSNGQSNDNF
ncbi:MAG: hypothetical protein EB002_04275 [Betaproteobacteria bacterium]|nr:hypothetical protein [Betaproteobacteria bacterium]